ncbi:DUF1624 domain-containing protein [Larkinella insperata]|uniref:DUF1624 domain-containing protein n=1 Tax=Larkinella insperata TaxID=332158 RepID=A0ABW3QIW4_9BACT|nr:heparan-alpha-glucosaminide N-acetyltransferase domain-containing protein [Larkinella insperata]
MIPATAPSQSRIASRILSIDVVRGLVMVVMALDHTRDFIHRNGFFYNATDLNTTSPILFFTRWITHFCAPAFVFLAGTSAYLMGRKMSKPQLRFFLITRGLWLIVLEVTVVNLNLWFDVTFSVLALEVIWATGVSMVVLGVLLTVPQNLLLGLGLIILLGHNALDSLSFPAGSALDIIWSILHRPNAIPLSPNQIVFIMYPVLPWIGILIVGYCFGALYSRDVDAEHRRKWLRWIGIASVTAFILIRAINRYGDPAPWSVQKTPLFTLLSFINVTKYPPSLLFALMTLGPVVWLLSALERKRGNWMLFFITYGRVPLFYFIIHFFLVHALSIGLLLLDGVAWSEINFQNRMGGVVPEHGLPLGITYGVWIGVVLIMYPLCEWYGQIKAKSRHPIWSYL